MAYNYKCEQENSHTQVFQQGDKRKMIQVEEKQSLNGSPVVATYKCKNKPKKRAFLCGDTVKSFCDGEYYIHHKQRHLFPYISLVEGLKKEGYEIDIKLEEAYQKDLEWEAQTENEKQSHFHSCLSTAAAAGKPVVVSSSKVHTTATIGRNYKVVLPNGQIEVVHSGCPTASYGDKVYYSNNDASILEAIREYNVLFA